MKKLDESNDNNKGWLNNIIFKKIINKKGLTDDDLKKNDLIIQLDLNYKKPLSQRSFIVGNYR